MGHHHHGHGHCHHHHTGDIKEMKNAFWLNLSFTFIELVGGIITNSFAIITDAFHDLGDSIALGVGIWLEKISQKEPNNRYTYGYKRFSLLSACILNTILITGSVLMIFGAIQKLFNPEEVESLGMMGFAVVGILANGLAMWRLSKRQDKDKANSRAMFLHFLEDVLGWVAVLVGGIIIHFTQWFWIDAVLSLGIACFILYNAVPSLVSIFKIFMQNAPAKINIEELTKNLKQLENVKDIHRLYLWTEDGNSHIITLHALVAAENLGDSDTIRHNIHTVLEKYHIHNSTIQIESKACGHR